MTIPKQPKIYHIAHISKLSAIVTDGFLFSNAEMNKREPVGVTIGMHEIKRRRLEELTLTSHPGLYVGQCVPFYFCPRSVMLYMFYRRNSPDIEYRGGQEPIIHLVADLRHTVTWAQKNNTRWAFTASNAGAYYFDDYADVKDLDKLDWDAIQADQWSGRQDKKQAEFLVETRFPWELIENIGVYSFEWVDKVNNDLKNANHKPVVRARREWYY